MADKKVPVASNYAEERLFRDMGDGTYAEVVTRPTRSITLKAAGAVTTAGTVNGDAVTGVGQYKRWVFLLDVTAADTEAGDTLDVYIDFSLDGTTWYNAVHFTQVTGTTSAKKEVAILDTTTPGTSVVDVTSNAGSGAVRPAVFGPQVRVRYVTVDVATLANMSFTFSVAAFASA